MSKTLRYLYLDLEALLEGTDRAALEAFIKAIKAGAVDAVLHMIPGIDELLVLLFGATIDAIRARHERLENVNKYLVSIETYNTACHDWANVMNKYVDSLRQFRTRAGKVMVPPDVPGSHP